jgi:hypothetical protein
MYDNNIYYGREVWDHDGVWSNKPRKGNRKKDTCEAFVVYAGSAIEVAPYSYGDNIDQSQVIFSDRYLVLVNEGLMTGDISGMNDAEKLSFKKFVDYEDGWDEFGNFTEPAYFSGDDLVVSEQLDKCLVMAVYGDETVQCSGNNTAGICCPF